MKKDAAKERQQEGREQLEKRSCLASRERVTSARREGSSSGRSTGGSPPLPSPPPSFCPLSCHSPPKKIETTKITKETRTVFLSRGLQKKRSPGREQGRHRRTGSVADTRERCAARITRRRREQRYIKYSASGLRGSERGARWLAAAGHW